MITENRFKLCYARNTCTAHAAAQENCARPMYSGRHCRYHHRCRFCSMDYYFFSNGKKHAGCCRTLTL